MLICITIYINQNNVMISKEVRERIRNKYNCKCAFCGCDVSKGMHIWDIEPIKTMVGEDGSLVTVNDNEENLLPACKSCEAVRRKNDCWGDSGKKMTIEEFRKDCIQSFNYLRNGGMTSTSYGRAIRFGQIVETRIELRFYFETMKIKT